jgi:hypothetical protein
LTGRLASISLGAEDPARFPILDFETNGIMCGYIDTSGKIAIPLTTNWSLMDDGPRYFLEGLQPTCFHGQTWNQGWGYLDPQGKVAIASRFSYAQPFSEGLAAVRDASGYGYIDHTGQYVIPPQFAEAFAFSNGYALVQVSNLWGYIDKHGAYIIKPQQYHTTATHGFAEGLVWVEKDGKWGCVNEKGETVIGFKFTDASYFSEGLAPVDVADHHAPPDLQGTMGYIDKTGAFVIAPQFYAAWNFSAGLARVQAGRNMAYIDKQGKIAFTITNGLWADEFSEGLANVSIRNSRDGTIPETWGYINLKGDFVIQPQYQMAKPFYHGLAQVFLNGHEGYIDKTGKFVWQGKPEPFEK